MRVSGAVISRYRLTRVKESLIKPCLVCRFSGRSHIISIPAKFLCGMPKNLRIIHASDLFIVFLKRI